VFAAVLAIDAGDAADIRSCAADFDDQGERSQLFDVNAEAINGYVDAFEGKSEGLARIRGAVAGLGTSSPAPGAISMLTRVLVGAHEWVGDPEAGRAAADSALRLEGTRLWEVELRRLRAVFLAGTGAPASDEAAELELALRVAESRSQVGPAQVVAATQAALLAPPMD
jgi:hypothetical protein